MNPCWGLLVSVGPLPSGQSPPCPWLRRRVLVDDCLPFCKLVSDLPIVERNLETPWTGWGGTEGGGGKDSTLCPAPQGPTPQGSSWDGPAQYKVQGNRGEGPGACLCEHTPHPMPLHTPLPQGQTHRHGTSQTRSPPELLGHTHVSVHKCAMRLSYSWTHTRHPAPWALPQTPDPKSFLSLETALPPQNLH